MTNLYLDIETCCNKLSIGAVYGRIPIVDMQKVRFRDFVIMPFIEEVKIQMATPPKNKPYYRQFEKRGKW